MQAQPDQATVNSAALSVVTNWRAAMKQLPQ
jgi:hypothetical protein